MEVKCGTITTSSKSIIIYINKLIFGKGGEYGNNKSNKRII